MRDRKTKTVEVTLGKRPASLSADSQSSQVP